MTRMRLHYTTIPIQDDYILNTIDDLNRMAEDGYRLVCIFSPGKGTQMMVVEKQVEA